MNPSSDSHEQLERSLHQTLRQLPDRRAPITLEQRVLAEIERRAALPWWRKSFAHWPGAARFVFVLACAGTVQLALIATGWISSGFDPEQYRAALAQQFAWMDAMLAVVQAIGNSFAVILRNIPSLWLYGSLAVFAAVYVTLFGLGAAAYKAVQEHP